jgi:hypothetical protein
VLDAVHEDALVHVPVDPVTDWHSVAVPTVYGDAVDCGSAEQEVALAQELHAVYWHSVPLAIVQLETFVQLLMTVTLPEHRV